MHRRRGFETRQVSLSLDFERLADRHVAALHPRERRYRLGCAGHRSFWLLYYRPYGYHERHAFAALDLRDRPHVVAREFEDLVQEWL